ncbi:MAG: flagellar basal body P-ring protein FlgI [Isosphaeraceae bacterium]
MWRVDPRRVRGFMALTTISALAVLAGAGPISKKKRAEAPPPKVDETISDLAYIASNSETKLEGVGLVVGLDDTGVDPPPSWYRQKLVDDMRKAGVEKPNEWLKNPKVAMVIVRMTVPSGVSPSDRLDVNIELPPASGTKSLAGGYLLETRLREVAVLGGVPKEGQEAALARGPVMTGTLANPADLKSGRVLGGGRVKKETPFQLILKENRKSFRTSALIESVVNQRFPQSQGVDQKGSATAKTDQFLVLKVPTIYHQNQDRFFRIVKLLPVADTPALRVQRMQAWGNDLLNPKTAGIAALRLEGLGVTAVELLQKGLASTNAQVRFFAAEALAYLGDPSGADVLSETVVNLPQFRAQALAALASNDQSVFHIKLRKLMDEGEVGVRYGAFNAARTLASDDPFLGQVRVLDDPQADEDGDEMPSENLALALATARRKPRVEDPRSRCTSLTARGRRGPRLAHPALARSWSSAARSSCRRPSCSAREPSSSMRPTATSRSRSARSCRAEFVDSDKKVSSSLEMGDVLRQTANLGATYPEIVAILQAADRQKNLPGPLVVDAVPAASLAYLDAAILGRDVTKKDAAVQTTKAEVAAPRRGLLNSQAFDSGTRGRQDGSGPGTQGG